MPSDSADTSQASRHPLEEADALRRVELILEMVEGHPEGRLELPRLDDPRLNLQGLYLNKRNLHEHLDRGERIGRWWHPEGYAQFRQADFQGADLQGADFSETDLTGADFSGVVMRGAVLRFARLETAKFVDADVSGTHFENGLASEADFSGALLEDARFRAATLRFANFTGALLDGANLEEADLWGARFAGADATDAAFKGTLLQEASFEGATLSGANFQNAQMKNANLRSAILRGADLRGVALTHANLENADLSEASLPRVDLATCNLKHVRIAGAWLENTRLSVEQLGGAVGEEIAGEFDAARQAYLALEQNFRTLGNPEAASWAFRKARRMGKRHSLSLLKQDCKARAWRAAATRLFEWSGDVFAEWLCDYGESLPRVVRAFVTTLVFFAVLYGVTGSLRYTSGSNGPVHNPLHLLGFSFLTMCTAGAPDLGFKPANLDVYFVASTQYIMGLVLIGLFGYVLGNRLRR
jgi:uncharacterized protein YjbI with pentapeptide repeats